MHRRYAFVAGSLAALAGCLSFDALSGGEPDAGEGPDATTLDVSSPVDVSIADASLSSVVDAFDCDAFPDAALCDDFNRTTVIPFSDIRWKSTDCPDGGSLSVDGTLISSDPSMTNAHCLLSSKPIPDTGHFTLDFDLSYDSDAAGTTAVIVAEVSFSLGAPNAEGLETALYQLELKGNGYGTLQVTDYYPDAAASPTPGAMYVGSTLAAANPFIEPSTVCHISLSVTNATSSAPSATGTSQCAGAHPITLTAASSVAGRGLRGTGELNLGFSVNGITSPWSVTYDNVVYTAQ